VGVPANATPTAGTDQLTTTVGTPLTIGCNELLANDTDTDGPLSLVPWDVSDPFHGILQRNEADGTFVYTPEQGYVGVDSFYYTAYDMEADSIPTLVTITVTSQM
jgi:hypothetical protein